MGVQPSPPKAGSAGPAATSKARSSKETGGTQAAVCTAVLVLLAALVWHVMPLHNWQLLQLLHHRVHVADDIIKPVKLHYPIWWQAPFYTGTGYSTEAISYLAALLQSGRFRPEDVWLSHSGDVIMEHVQDSLDETTRQLLQDQEYSNLSRGRLNATELDRPAIAVCHSFPDCWRMQNDIASMVTGCPCPMENDKVAYRIGRTMFETASLPQHLVQHCNAMDEVWVPSEFNKETFISAGVAPEKLRVVPQGIDAADFDPNKHAPLSLKDLPSAQLVTGNSTGINSDSYTFLSVFKWEARKGWDVLLDAYVREFSKSDNVALHIFTKPFGRSDEDIASQVQSWLSKRLGIQQSSLPDLPRIYVHTAYIDGGTYRRLYASADCVVLPTRGEGWGRPAMEAMSMAKPVITTNWSGPTAYINEKVAYPLAYDAITAASGDMDSTKVDEHSWNEYFAGQHWAQPSVTHLCQLMRRVVTHPAEAAAKGRVARAHVLANFTPDVLARVIMREVLRIQEKLGPDLKLPTAEERAARQQSAALCSAYPHLCRQGSAGLAEAAKRAQSSHSQYRARQGAARSIIPGQLSVQELLARSREAMLQQASLALAQSIDRSEAA